ncbi:CPBP family intramembrane metalloprotease [Pedobacter petrophilus]|uniref:CPBP family intramembrane metalloprotease n=1 Tax=Pedobacter petrophilus TaxID=1908241 RepID=A0A7K0G1S0_9SPHI|nr:CPBP family glutamic-type intramembrane protease [Pedobacter petrophilus]MRX77390.1 CPBP family intramembrane metalloprotease [Pedobacter petrophilus]
MEAINGVQKTASNQNNILFFLIFAPIVEELIFRLPLKVSRLNIFISALMAYFLFYLSHKPISSLITANELIKFVVFISLSILVLSSLKERFLSFVLHKYFGVYFYALITVFGLLHLTNFLSAVPGNLIAFAPLFAFHQVIVGFFLGYLRLKNGLIWCILLHSLFNLLPTISYFINK